VSDERLQQRDVPEEQIETLEREDEDSGDQDQIERTEEEIKELEDDD
jgi:hypothetical protein